MPLCAFADLIDAAEVLGEGNVTGGSGSSNYTSVAYVSGAGKGLTVAPAGGDTTKRLFIPNAGDRIASGAMRHYGAESQLWPATQSDASLAYFFIFSAGELPGRIYPISKLYAFPLRCVRS